MHFVLLNKKLLIWKSILINFDNILKELQSLQNSEGMFLLRNWSNEKIAKMERKQINFQIFHENFYKQRCRGICIFKKTH